MNDQTMRRRDPLAESVSYSLDGLQQLRRENMTLTDLNRDLERQLIEAQAEAAAIGRQLERATAELDTYKTLSIELTNSFRTVQGILQDVFDKALAAVRDARSSRQHEADQPQDRGAPKGDDSEAPTATATPDGSGPVDDGEPPPKFLTQT